MRPLGEVLRKSPLGDKTKLTEPLKPMGPTQGVFRNSPLRDKSVPRGPSKTTLPTIGEVGSWVYCYDITNIFGGRGLCEKATTFS